VVLDTSAIITILRREAFADRLVVAVEADLVSAATVVETGDDFAKTDVEVCTW
jgi:uncharacterized protein with PIN domain